MRLFARLACGVAGLLGLVAIFVTGCNEHPVTGSQQANATDETEQATNVIASTDPAPVDQRSTQSWNPIDALLQTIGSHAVVSYATNADDVVICTVKCADLNERRRLRDEVMAISGSCNGTVDPPTVSFRLTDLSHLRRPPVYDPAAEEARNHEVAARLQQRKAMEEAIDRREIRDAEAQLQYDRVNMLGGPGSGFAVNKAQILSAESTRLDDLRAWFVEKYGHEP